MSKIMPIAYISGPFFAYAPTQQTNLNGSIRVPYETKPFIQYVRPKERKIKIGTLGTLLWQEISTMLSSFIRI